MTPAERLECALSREMPDRVPIYDIVSNVALIERVAGERLTEQNGRRVMPRAVGHLLDHTRVNFPAPLGRWTDERGVIWERREWFNDWVVGVPWKDLSELRKWIAGDIERLEAWRPPTPAEQEQALKRRLETQSWYGGELVISGHETFEALQDAWICLGLENYVALDAEAPELVKRWIDAIHDHRVRRLEAETWCRRVSPVGWIFDDIAYNSGLIFSPEYLRERGVFR